MLAPALCLWMLVAEGGAPAAPPPAECEARRRIELADREPHPDLEVCVSPGLVTSFVFDTPAVVDLQDETRFLDVTRGPSSIHIRPSHDMMAGERLRLTAHLGAGKAQEEVTLTLVARDGPVTHQVDVFRDPRSVASLREELHEERARVLALREALARLERSASRLGPVQRLLVDQIMDSAGVRSTGAAGNPLVHQENQLSVVNSVLFRSSTRVAVDMWLLNAGEQPWTPVGVSLGRTGQVPRTPLWVGATIAPRTQGRILVELEVLEQGDLGAMTLSLWEAGPRIIHIPDVTFPK